MPPKAAKAKKAPVQRSDYAIVFLNADHDSLEPLLDNYCQEARLQKRRAVAVIGQQTINEIILSEKENSSIQRGKPFVLAGQDAPADIVLQIIQTRISELYAENERLLRVQETVRSFDMLQFWRENDEETIPSTTAGKGKGKEKGAEKDKAKLDKNRIAVPAPLEKIVLPDYVLNSWCSLGIRGQNSNKKIFIEDSPEDGPNLYVVILGIYSKDVIEGLVKNAYPVTVIIKLTPIEVTGDPPTQKYSEFWDDMQKTIAADLTKSVGLFTVHIPARPASEILSNIDQISTEINGLVYDSNEWKRQYLNYLDNITEYDVEDKINCLEMTDSELYGGYFDHIDKEPIGVEHILDALLLRTVELSLISTLKVSPSEVTLKGIELSEHLHEKEPFYFKIGNKYIMEHQDDLLRSTHFAPDMNFTQYGFLMDSYINGYALDRFVPHTPSNMHGDGSLEIDCKPGNNAYLDFEYFLNLLSLKKIHDDTSQQRDESELKQIANITKYTTLEKESISEYIELMSPQALQQQIVASLNAFKNVKTVFNPLTGSNLIVFWDEPLTKTESILRTKVCFRDFMKFIKTEEHDWIHGQEQIHDRMTAKPHQLYPIGTNNTFSSIDPEAFLINRSLKKHGNMDYDGDYLPPAPKNNKPADDQPIIIRDVKHSKKSAETASKKSKKSNTTAGSIVTTRSAGSESVKPFTGFNLGDRRVQLNSETRVYRTAICTIRYTLDVWMYLESILNVVVQLDGLELLFGQKFLDNDHPDKNDKKSILVKCDDGSSMTLQVVVQQDQLARPSVLTGSYAESTRAPANSDPRGLVLRLTKSNGLIIKTCNSSLTAEMLVEQTWIQSRDEEVSRSMYSNGCVVTFLTTGFVRIFSSNGMIFETGLEGQWDLEKELSVTKSTSVTRSRQPFAVIELHRDALSLVFQMLPNLKSAYSKVITSDGSVFIMNEGQIVKELKKKYIKETFDFYANELYVRREDGFKMIYNFDRSICVYPDGTEIITTFFEQIIDVDSIIISEDRFNSATMVSSLGLKNRSNEDTIRIRKSGPFSTRLKNNVENKMSNYVSSENSYQLLKRSFTIKHERYHSITFDNENNRVQFPNSKFPTTFSRHMISAQLSPDVKLVCDTACIELTGTQCEKHSKSSVTKIWFDTNEDYILQNTDGFGQRFAIFKNGRCSETSRSDGDRLKKGQCTYCDFVNWGSSMRQFVVKQNWNGYEVLSANDVDKFVGNSRDKSRIVLRTNEYISTMSPLKKPPKIEEGIAQRDLYDIKCCASRTHLAPELPEEIPQKMIHRNFVKIIPHSDVDITKITSTLNNGGNNGNISKRLTCENNVSVKSLMCQAANKAIAYHLAHEEVRRIEEAALSKVGGSKGFAVRMQQIHEQQSRDRLYRRILKNDFKPKYAQFKAAREHVGNLNVEDIMHDIDVWLENAKPNACV